MTQIELYKEYIRILELCENTDVDPKSCIRYCGREYPEHTIDLSKPSENYTFAIRLVENKPVFIGDVLFHKFTCDTVIVQRNLHISILKDCTWEPNYAAIKSRVEKLEYKIAKLTETLNSLRDTCQHKNYKKTYLANSSGDSYCIECKCHICGKSWSEDQ